MVGLRCGWSRIWLSFSEISFGFDHGGKLCRNSDSPLHTMPSREERLHAIVSGRSSETYSSWIGMLILEVIITSARVDGRRAGAVWQPGFRWGTGFPGTCWTSQNQRPRGKRKHGEQAGGIGRDHMHLIQHLSPLAVMAFWGPDGNLKRQRQSQFVVTREIWTHS